MARSKQGSSGGGGGQRKETKEERRLRLERQAQAREVSTVVSAVLCGRFGPCDPYYPSTSYSHTPLVLTAYACCLLSIDLS
jgi:hypothetical protein